MRRAVIAIAAALLLAMSLLLLVSSPPAGASTAPVPRRITAYNWAVTQRGAPYSWGGTGPYWSGYDCSGLAVASYRRVRIYLPRTTYGMIAAIRTGLLIPERYPRKGDLAFYGSGHVELYDTGHTTFGALEPGIPLGWHAWGGWWAPTLFLRVRGAG